MGLQRYCERPAVANGYSLMTTILRPSLGSTPRWNRVLVIPGVSICCNTSVNSTAHKPHRPGLYRSTCATSCRCELFATCTADNDRSDLSGTSQINADTLELYQEGQAYLLDGDCEGAEEVKDRIVELMTVPLLQGLLRYVLVDRARYGACSKALGLPAPCGSSLIRARPLYSPGKCFFESTLSYCPPFRSSRPFDVPRQPLQQHSASARSNALSCQEIGR